MRKKATPGEERPPGQVTRRRWQPIKEQKVEGKSSSSTIVKMRSVLQVDFKFYFWPQKFEWFYNQRTLIKARHH